MFAEVKQAVGNGHGVLVRFMPWIFVLIWSTGFIVARLAMPHAPPFSFLSGRFLLSALCLFVWAMWAKTAWPSNRQQWVHLAVTGVLMQTGYLGGVWSAVKGGIGAGTVSLIVGLQPVLTAMWVTRTAGRVDGAVSVLQWSGLFLGLAGLALVVSGKVGVGEITPLNLSLAVVALLSITAGTLYQKRFVAPCDVRSASVVQMLAALVISLPLALFERDSMQWRGDLMAAMAWSVLVLTLGGSSLLYLLIQKGEATAVTSLLYLVPPCTAAMAYFFFGEAFTTLMLLGMVLTVAGVALVVRARPTLPTVAS